VSSLVIVRFLSIAYSFIRYPIVSIGEIPSNWFRLVLTVDIFYPPEMFPFFEAEAIQGFIYKSAPFQGLINFQGLVKWKPFFNSLRENLSNFRSDDEDYTKNSVLIAYILIALLIYLPSLLYRISIKSTSIIYLPLIYIAGNKISQNANIRIVLTDILQSKFERIKIMFAHVMAFFTIFIPVIIFIYKQQIAKWLSESYLLSYILPMEKIFAYLFPIHEINSWHLARSCNVLITLSMFYYADKIRVRLDAGDHSMDERALFLLTSGRRLRTVLSLWTIFCGLYLVYSTVDGGIQLPRIRWLPF
jgi:hypothetical protein